MGSNHLTFYQEKVYSFIKEYIQLNGYAPYIREIQHACNINSHKSVIDRLSSLEKKGYIKRKFNKHRNIKLIKRKENLAL